jgi:hypothetical protein
MELSDGSMRVCPQTFWPAKSISFSSCAHVISDVWALSQVRKLGRDKSFNLNVFLLIFQRRSLSAEILRKHLQHTSKPQKNMEFVLKGWENRRKMIIKSTVDHQIVVYKCLCRFSHIPWYHKSTITPDFQTYGCFLKSGYTKWMVSFMVNPMKMIENGWFGGCTHVRKPPNMVKEYG